MQLDIKHARRILAVGFHDSGVVDVIKDLTASPPALNDEGTTAGISHEWNVNTTYYKANVPIWLDEIQDVAAWKAEFLKPEAKEVIEAVGAWIYCFRPGNGEARLRSEVEQVLEAIQSITEEHMGASTDTVMLAVAIPTSPKTKVQMALEDYEDACLQYGFEFIDYAASGKNAFGEKTGYERLKEALEANEWAADDADFETRLLGGDEAIFGDHDGLQFDEAEMTAELFGLKAALGVDRSDDGAGNDEEGAQSKSERREVEDLDGLMGRLLAVREQSVDLPEAERKRIAARAVRDIMEGL